MKLILMFLALGLAFGAGWLFGNEVRPPLLEDVNLGAWSAVAGISLLAAIVVSR